MNKLFLNGQMSSLVNNINHALFSVEQLNWQKSAREFAASVSQDDIIKSDKDNQFRRDLFEAACKLGFGRLPFSPEYGGADGDYVSFALVNEELARRCFPVMSSIGVHVLCQEPIYKFGTQAQKTKYLMPTSAGKTLAAFALTEPAAGSDTAAIETSARLSGNSYILNGSKIFITSGSVADIYIVFARLPEGISAFIVERESPGLSAGQKFDMLGMRGYGTCEMVFSDCQIPKENILGEPGMGRKVALSSLARGRVTIAAQAVGWARGALDGLNRCLKQPGLNKATSNTVIYLAGDLLINIEAASALTYQAAQAIDHAQDDIALAAMAKLKATDVAMQAADRALSLLDAEGLAPEFLLERIFRDAKAGQIYEGTNQIQHMLIARNLL
jgi:alkylation response protein AidB-like acyl-CoA dehydrogenase